MNRVVFADAGLIGEIASRLQHDGFNATLLRDSTDLNAWLSEQKTLVPDHPVTAAIPAVEKKSRETDSNRLWLIDSVQMGLTSPDGKYVPLTHGEYCILRTAANAQGKLVSRSTLIEALGKNPLHYNERCLEMLISRLRSKLASATQENFPLRGVRNQGYFFGARLQEAGV